MSRLTSRLAALLVLGLASTTSGQSVYPFGVTVWDQQAAFTGFTLYPSLAGTMVLIDMDGTKVNEWTSPIAGQTLIFGEPLSEGRVLSMSRVPQGGSNGSRDIVELDWDNNVLWQYTAPPEIWAFHHDAERLQNGNTLILANEHIPFGLAVDLEDDCLLEVDPGGNVVWDWRTVDHLAEFGFTPIAAQHAVALIEENNGDWAHANSATVIPPNDHTDPAFTPGNIIVSQRTTNIVFIIDKATGDVVWQTDPNDPLTYGQHHPTMILQGFQGAGNILIYDNGANAGYGIVPHRAAYTRLLEINPSTMETVWEYTAVANGEMNRRFFADIVGSAQRLQNGNTLTVEGPEARIFEVAPDGTIVWEYMGDEALLTGPPGGQFNLRVIYRAYRVRYSFAP